jgi:GAF domain
VRKGLERLRRELGSLPRETAITLLATLAVTIIAPVVLGVAIGDEVPVWALVLAIGISFCVGVVRGASKEHADERRQEVEPGIAALESQVATLRSYDTYAIHVRDALEDLRRVLADELRNFSLRDFIETGIFEPAHVLLQRDHEDAPRGEIRFSILHPSRDGRDFVMADGDQLYAAHGHRAESRQKFRISIAGSFAGVAFQTGKVQASNRLSDDDRYAPHPRASEGREYESMISVPLIREGRIDGVLNVIATRRNAFSDVDRTYITLLASVIDVARSVVGRHPSHASE